MKEEKKEYRTQQIIVKKGHRLYDYFNSMCTNSKNIYNTTNFYIRQVYTALKSEKSLQPLQKDILDIIKLSLPKMNELQLIAFQKNLEKEKKKPKEKQKEIKANLFELPSKENAFINYNFLDCLFKVTAQIDYRSVPAQSAQNVMKKVYDDWTSFFESIKDYEKNPTKYTGKPNIPGYKKTVMQEAYFSNQDCTIKDGSYLKFPYTKIRLNIGKLGLTSSKLKQVRVLPLKNQFQVELVYDAPKTAYKEKQNRLMSIDLGVDNLATAVTNTGRKPFIIKGTVLKSMNQFYNKKRANYYSIFRMGKNPKEGAFTSKRLDHLDRKRYLRTKDYYHKASHEIVKRAHELNIDTIYIGLNNGWKQQLKMNKKTKQSFSFISHDLLIQMIKYKAKEKGIEVITCEESYTSKASFLDGDLIPTYNSGNQTKHVFSGRRAKRGLYKSKVGTIINADVNGACNILRKVVPNAFADGITGVVLRPEVVKNPTWVHPSKLSAL